MHDCRLLRGVIRSSRPANIPTLFTNAAVAWAAVRGAELPPAGLYAGVVLMGVCFYLYGMWENDRVDARWDASRYPDRPVPCGAVSVSVLRLLSLVAGLSGLVLNMALGGEFAAGAVLLIVISLYNMFHKLWSGSVFLMGAVPRAVGAGRRAGVCPCGRGTRAARVPAVVCFRPVCVYLPDFHGGPA